jgi:hypothetical protein
MTTEYSSDELLPITITNGAGIRFTWDEEQRILTISLA